MVKLVVALERVNDERARHTDLTSKHAVAEGLAAPASNAMVEPAAHVEQEPNSAAMAPLLMPSTE